MKKIIIGVVLLFGLTLVMPQAVEVASAQTACGVENSTGGCSGKNIGQECRTAAQSTDDIADVCKANAVGDCSCPNGTAGNAIASNDDDSEVTTDFLFGGGKLTAEQVRTETGLGSRDPRAIIASVINIVLGFLGIIAVLLIVIGGFRWMTAQGNDEQIAGAKNLMIAGVIGLIIILAAFGIARFVVDALVDATA